MGEEVDIGTCRTILVEKFQEAKAAAASKDEEPDFMKYIKNMNIDFVNTDYLKEHFSEEDAKPAQLNPIAQHEVAEDEVPEELRGLSVDQVQQNLERLKVDMEAELEVIRMRYNEKIASY